MAISSIGIGSGLKVDEILANLRKVENQSLQLVQNRMVDNNQRITAYGKLKNAIENLQKAGANLNKAETYGAVKVSSSTELIAISGTHKANPGQYSLEVKELASSQSLLATGQESRTTAIGVGGKISVTLLNGDTHTLDLADKSTSLNELVLAINADPKLGISATLINDGTEQPHRLLLTANQAGTQSSVATIRVEDNTALADLLSFTQNGTPSDTSPPGSFTETAATNARIEVNGIAITQQSNTLENTIEGLSIDISKAKLNERISLNVSRDDGVASKAIKDFVAAYNALNSLSKDLTHYNVDQQKSSPLTGDSLVRRAQNSIHQALSLASSEGEIRNLSKLGITLDPNTGELVLKEETVNAALRDHLADVKRLFTGDLGIGKQIEDTGKLYTKKDGFIDNAIDGATRTDKLLQKQYDATSVRVDSKIEAYRKQFAQLDTMVSQMNGLSSYLTQQLSMLGNLNNSGK